MLRKLVTLIAALCTAVGLAILLPTASAGAAPACVAAWNSSSVYTGGMTASYNGHNWYAKWWTQNERPGSSDVWRDEGVCGTGGGGTDPSPSGFVVSEAQFNQMFPNRSPFYTYAGLVAALKSYPGFATTGSDTVKKQEAAAFLANVSHETGGLYYIVEQNTANYPHYCDTTRPYGCPAGQAAYYGRGPIQLSWNFNYKAAGDALGIDLLNNPWRVEQDPAVAMQTGLWYWNTQNGPGTMTAHNAMVNGAGFGQTIWAINGSLECNGGNPAQVQSRVTKYQQFTQILGVPAGANLYC
ncbi:glycoside hydrolase family 19 protein [Streptomyces sp. NK15101]|uniref:glycoside hydrolase family 19 protein n=1 Tax=Streptomyces sp. NK15101 TaxID=2873261 RepID=UPI001CEC5E26|nr:glycoside hydrolase family 19 protein [Streptomyces sp. NK15101]